jgi:hypothetical protein
MVDVFRRFRRKKGFNAERKVEPIYDIQSRIIVPDTAVKITIRVVCEKCAETYHTIEVEAPFLGFLHWCHGVTGPKKNLKPIITN